MVLAQLATIFGGGATSDFLRGLANDDWFALLATVNRHRLAPALNAVLFQGGVVQSVPEDVRDYLALVVEFNEARNAAVRDEIRQTVAALNHAGVEPMLLKGSVALMHETQVIRNRMIGDIDVLVPEEQQAESLIAMTKAGFRQVKGYPEAAHTIADLMRPGNCACVDLHRALFDPPFQKVLQAAELFKQADRVVDYGIRYALPSLSHHTLHIVVHAQILEANYYCRRLCLGPARELAALAPNVEWSQVESWARARHLLFLLESILLSSAQFFGIAWPLSTPPSQTALRHHQRACATEVAGGWDIGLSRAALIRELFAPDRLAVAFGHERKYAANMARQCQHLLKKRNLPRLVQLLR